MLLEVLVIVLEVWKLNWNHKNCKNGVSGSKIWVRVLRVAALQAMPRPACPELAKNQSVQIHEINAAAWFGL